LILPLLSASFAALALTLYVMLDGFDLGVGMLLLFQGDQASRNHMVDSITPTWDGNETWLILAGVTLLAAFPLAYGILLPALYIPLIVMLLSLGLRGVSFEFRVHARHLRIWWDRIFAFGSLLAALMQGMATGALLEGMPVRGGEYTGGPLDFLSPLSVMTAVALATGYMVLGCGWLYLKGNIRIERFVRRSLFLLVPALFVLSGTVIWCAITFVGDVRSSVHAHTTALFVIAGASAVLLLAILPCIKRTMEVAPFVLGLGTFALGIAALITLVYPDIVPFRVSLWQAAASRMSQLFLLVGAFFVTPIVLAYSLFSYWIFRGKTPEEGWES
jgi:cytochrome bd ubiquinol oxidase subunit II